MLKFWNWHFFSRIGQQEQRLLHETIVYRPTNERPIRAQKLCVHITLL